MYRLNDALDRARIVEETGGVGTGKALQALGGGVVASSEE